MRRNQLLNETHEIVNNLLTAVNKLITLWRKGYTAKPNPPIFRIFNELFHEMPILQINDELYYVKQLTPEIYWQWTRDLIHLPVTCYFSISFVKEPYVVVQCILNASTPKKRFDVLIEHNKRELYRLEELPNPQHFVRYLRELTSYLSKKVVYIEDIVVYEVL